MPHYIAFLRGMNLGNRRLKMDELRARFVELKFANVETFIASGNVVFESKERNAAKLTAQIEAHLAKKLGYAVDTFLRTRAELAAVAAFRPFAKADMDNPAHAIYCSFLREPLSAARARGLLARRTEVHEFRVQGREFYWLCRVRSPESTQLWFTPEMRALKLPTSSARNLTTIRKMAGLYPTAVP